MFFNDSISSRTEMSSKKYKTEQSDPFIIKCVSNPTPV